MAQQSVAPYSKSHAMPEPMNASSHHPKIKLSITPGEALFVAGTYVTGKLEMECRAEGERGLGIGVVMIELFAIQELASRDHLATNTFLHSRRLFQGPGLPPSNAVFPHPLPPSHDVPVLPQNYFPARRGRSTFFFRIPLPGTCPSSISFALGQAKVKYELRGSAGVFWKNERRLVFCRKAVEVVERFVVEEAMELDMHGGGMILKVPEAVVVGENGKIWMQGRILGGLVVAGGSACVELQVKNHSTKKNTSLTLLLIRTLYLPVLSTDNPNSPPPVQMSDTLVTVPFRGPEYIIQPGGEGVANLVFDVPKEARGVMGGMLDGEELEGEGRLRLSQSLFEIRCKVEVRLSLGMGSKDIRLEIPIEVIHPNAVPEDLNLISPTPTPYVDQTQVWIPPPVTPYPYVMSQPTGLGLTFGVGVPYMHTGANQISLPLSPSPQTPQPPILLANHNIDPPFQQTLQPPHFPHRPLSAGPITSASQLPQSMIPGFPAPEVNPIGLLPFPALGGNMSPPISAEMARTVDPAYQYIQYHSPPPAESHQEQLTPTALAFAATSYEPEEGKGERALRVCRHLRQSSRHRSVSPISHRYPPSQPLPGADESSASAQQPRTRMLPVPPLVMSPGSPGMTTLAQRPAQDEFLLPSTTVLHSPRPQLTPKHSLTNITDAYNTTTLITMKSERVEELEKMADVVVRRSGDNLSGDLPKDVIEQVEEELRERDRAKEGVVAPEKSFSLQRNKTLPGPPSPVVHETEPLPSDQTPPTPNLHALAMRSRGQDKDREKRELLQELRTDNGLDALEQRLLREVGTRKMNVPPRPDVRGVLQNLVSSPLEPVKESDFDAVTGQADGRRKSDEGPIPIPIPMKSPETLNDSAISSLTLAGRVLDDMDDDQDSDGGRTHRAWSKSSMGIERGEGRERGEGIDEPLDDDWGELLPLRHTRERAEIVVSGRTPKTPEKLKEQTSFTNEKPAAQRKKDTKAKAKGRVAAWLGEIDIGVPPQEQIIPPSPSVVRGPDEISIMLDDEDDERREKEQETKGTASPNPRSSGFVPIETTVNATTALNRNTTHFSLGLGPSSRPLMILRDATVDKEAKRVQALWDSGADMSSLGYAPAQAKLREEATKTPMQAETQPATAKFPLSFPIVARVQSIRTDRRVSPPSNVAKQQRGVGQQGKELTVQQQSRAGQAPSFTSTPMSYSAAAKNAWKAVDASARRSSPPEKTTHPSFASDKPIANAERLPSLPPLNTKPSRDVEARYGVRSARGGRGGKVTAVANLWASGAIMNQGASTSNSNKTAAPTAKVKVLAGLENIDREKGRASRAFEERQRRTVDVLDNRQIMKPPVKDDAKPAIPTKTEKKTFSAALMSPAPPPSKSPLSSSLAFGGASNARKLAALPRPLSIVPSSSKHVTEAQKRPDSRTVFTKPNFPPRRTTSNMPTKRPATAASTPRSGSGSQSPQLSQGGRTTPMLIFRTSLSTPPSPSRGKPDRTAPPVTTAAPVPKVAAAGGGVKPKPGMIIPPSTNPASAVLSSSHAVPHLSSTASLVRPTSTTSPLWSSNHAPMSSPPRMFPTMLSTSKSAPSLQAEMSDAVHTRPPRFGSPGKSPDLSFGKARLRDLIKKYQAQGT